MVEDRNSELRKKVHNVARPDDSAPNDARSKLVKQAEIKNKIIEAAEDQDMDDKKKKKSGEVSDTDHMDAKEIKGGKTEVNLKPTTDDRPEDATKEDEKGKKAAKDENKKIGAKGVKEETMTNKHFGLPESLIRTVDEVLKGNQHKLDKNHNGKIDAEDFKLLKGKKKMTEGKCPECGMNPCKCGPHIKEAADKNKDIDGAESGKKSERDRTKKVNKEKKDWMKEAKSCTCEGKGPCQCSTNEEVKQIDELDRDGILKRYANKAMKKVEGGEESPEKRAAGRLMAGKKRWGGTGGIPSAKVPGTTKEEVELSAEELARIEEIAKGL
jgi:hypothetical protein